MNKKIILGSVAVLLMVIAGGAGAWIKLSIPTIAFVRSAKVVDGYLGMKEAKSLYNDKVSKWKSNIDTLQMDYQKSVSAYNSEISSLSAKAKQERENLLRKQEANVRQYVEMLEQKAEEEDQRMTEGVVNQINSFINEYGEKNGYDLILGVTRDGSILYGKDAIDITDEVIKGLNKNYKTGSFSAK